MIRHSFYKLPPSRVMQRLDIAIESDDNCYSFCAHSPQYNHHSAAIYPNHQHNGTNVSAA